METPHEDDQETLRPAETRCGWHGFRGFCISLKVYAVVNYDGFELDGDPEDGYLDAVQEMDDTYFHGVTRFTTSAFMRAKLGSALESRGVAPHIYESEDEAAGAVRTTLQRQE